MNRRLQSDFEDALVSALMESDPPAAAPSDVQAVEREVSLGIMAARRHGFSSDGDVARFIELVFHRLGGFIGAALPPDVRAILDDRRLTEAARLDRLARHLGSDRSSRAVGRRSHKNGLEVPRPLIQPCSRRPLQHWVEIRMVDSDTGAPAQGVEYLVILPDGGVIRGNLDAEGTALVEGLEDPGMCRIEFPRLDETLWSVA